MLPYYCLKNIKYLLLSLQVVPSVLKVSLIQGALSVITRGPGQVIDLEPYKFTEDPDYPDDKVFEFTWFCRSEDDPSFPMDGIALREIHNLKVNPLFQSSPDKGPGCFGDGPGAIGLIANKISIRTSQFVESNKTYEVMVMAQKKDRYALASLNINLVTYKPPIPKIQCADEGLCRPTFEGILISPSLRLALRSTCIAECADNMTITWRLTDSQGQLITSLEEETLTPIIEVSLNSTSTTELPSLGNMTTLSGLRLNYFPEILTTIDGYTVTEESFEENLSLSSTVEMISYMDMVKSSMTSSTSGNLTAMFPTGLSSSDLAISSEVFSKYPCNKYLLYLTLETADKRKGETTLSLIINKSPTGGNCSLNPDKGLALISSFELTCDNWADPDGVGMGQYSFYTFEDESVKKTIVASRNSHVTVVLPVGDMNIYCDISDIDGTFTEYHVGLAKVTVPSKEQYEGHDVDALISKLNAMGDGQMTGMVLAAQASIREQGDWFSLEGLSEEEEDNRLRSLAKMNTQALKNVENTMSLVTLQHLNIAGSVISSTVDGVSGTKGAAKTVDMEARETAIVIMDKMIGNVDQMSVPAPQDLTPFLFSTLSSMASIMEGIKLIVMGDNIDNVPPTDVDAAMDWEYSVALTDDLSQEIPNTKEEMLQKNVMDTTKLKAKEQIKQMMKVVEKLSLTLEKKIVKGEALHVDTANGVSYAIQQITEKVLRPGMILSVGSDSGEIRMPKLFCPTLGIYNNSTCDHIISITVIQWPTITHSYPDSAKHLSPGTRVIDMMVTTKGQTLDIENKTGPITVIIPRIPETLPPPKVVDASHPLVARISYHQVVVEHPDAALYIEMSSDVDDNLVLLMDYDRMPTPSKFELCERFVNISINEAGIRELFLDNDFINGRMGRFFFGVASINASSSRHKRSVVSDATDYEFEENLPGNYSFRVITTGCYYFNQKTNEWDTQGLKVLSANSNHTVCWSPRLGSFAAGYAHTPNNITFDYYHAPQSYNDYATLYSTVAITLAVSVILLVWARFKDRKDIEKRGATPLPDNLPEDKYLYEIVVFTGSASEASCQSNIEFILSGEEDETEIRILADYEREVFARHGVDTFVMAVPRPLGSLYYLRLWHDNSGPGIYSSWQVAFVSVRDLQTGVETSFIANRWIAIDRDDQQIDVILKAAQEDDRKNFGHLYGVVKQLGIKDRHLWFSIFSRPPRSRYTRKRRAAVCATYLFISMVLSVLCYVILEELQDQAIKDEQDPIEFGIMMKMMIGLVVMAATYPPVLVLIFVFRRSRPRLRPEARSIAAINAQHKMSGVEHPSSMIQPFSKGHKESDSESLPRSVGPYVLPWWCALIAWFFVIGIIAGSIFFVYSQSVIFNSTSMSGWCHSFITAFLASFLVIENLMVVVRAVFFAYCCKPQNIDADDIDYDEKAPVLFMDEEWLHPRPRGPPPRLVHDIIGNRDISDLKELSDKLVQERAMKLILRDLAFYFVFLGILWVVSSINPNAIYMVQNFRNAFIKEGDPIWDYKNKVTNSDLYWRWLKTVMLDELRTRRWYNGEPPYGLRGFLDDKVNRIMGYAILRQIRLDKNKCSVPYSMQENVEWCSGIRGIELEDSRDYCAHWKDTEDFEGACKTPEFRYKTPEELDAFAKSGRLGSYSGGGYVVELKGATSAIKKNLDFLHRHDWIDSHTRAILLEFSVYNTNVNLFGICTIRAEFHPGGGIRTSWRFDAKELLPDNSGI
ncbi:polycystin-1-like protein 2 [Oratosquilla oratoria]|uniref:polycystin-1-like protein 2 n=1 Tax=Oratosquilla oratoria TaxID=337810 RepID=UPI003F75C20D